MSESSCATCALRAKYDANPRSLLGRVWRWHANFCPGWRGHMRSLPDDDRRALVERYSFPKGKFD
ncbi:MAG: hypothetical protein MUE90_04740 [Thermoanaerobaculales bacterium]|jgi:hypothetical protein|nr:hypothetical protein [Thermoanaerobaculales bacterium]